MVPNNTRRKRGITVSLTEAEYHKLSLLARHAGLSRSAALRNAALDINLEQKLKEAYVRALLELMRRLESDASPDLLAPLRGALAEAEQLLE